LTESVKRGVAAFGGYALGEATTNKFLTKYKDKNQGMIGLGKVALSHVVAPMIIPDEYMGMEMVQSGLDGFGVSGVKDTLMAFSKDFATSIGISGTGYAVDYGNQRTRIPAPAKAGVPESADLNS
jgi:hypothetical protein